MLLPGEVDLSRGKSPEDFYVCLIPDRMGVEAWRASPHALDDTIPSSNWCAMTCLRMLLLLHDREAPSLQELFEAACAAQVYRPKEEGVGWAGAYHAPLTHFIHRFGFSTQPVQDVSTNVLAEALSHGLYVIPSVGPDIRFPQDTGEPKKKTGHFVLMYGYHTDSGTRYFKIQNSAGFVSQNSQIGVSISEARLGQVFSGRAILVHPLTAEGSMIA